MIVPDLPRAEHARIMVVLSRAAENGESRGTWNGTMTVELMPEDPDIFVKPWKVVLTLFLAPGESLMENICENNKFSELSAGQNP